jgi:hypothetical protein
MDNNEMTHSDGTIGPRELLIASFIVAIGLAVFGICYWMARNIGALLFN